MDLLIKTAAVCVPAALIASLLRRDSPAMSVLLALAAGCVVIYSALGALGEIVSFVRELAELGSVSGPVTGVLLKTLGIAVVSRLTSDLCRDAGLTTAGSAAELAAGAAALYTALPVMRGLIRVIGEML